MSILREEAKELVGENIDAILGVLDAVNDGSEELFSSYAKLYRKAFDELKKEMFDDKQALTIVTFMMDKINNIK